MTRPMRKKKEHHVQRSERDGRVVWIKPARPEKGTRWHAIMGGIAKTLSFPLAARTINPGGAAGLRLEAERLKQAAARGAHVPLVLALTPERVVMTDIGVSLETVLRGEADPAARFALLAKAARALADFHAKGLVHGRPYLRDMTWDGEKIGFIDLEDDPLGAMPFASAQARDVWLFLNTSASAVLQEPDRERAVSFLLDLFKAYAEKAPRGYESELHRLVKVVRVLRRALGFVLLRNNAPRDLRRSALANRALERHFSF